MHKIFEDYQRFTKTTAVYPDKHTKVYLTLGMCDEAGELLEKVAWVGPKFSARSKAEVLAEAGDVLWYIARFTDEQGICLGHLYDTRTYDGPATLEGAAMVVSIELARIAGRVKKELRDGDNWTDEQRSKAELTIMLALRNTMGALDAMVRGLTETLADVAAANQAKLSDRRDRGVIKGDGDHR